MMIPFVLFLTHSLVRIAQSEMHTLTHTQRPVCSCFSIQTQTASAHARIYLKMKFNSACIGYVTLVRSFAHSFVCWLVFLICLWISFFVLLVVCSLVSAFEFSECEDMSGVRCGKCCAYTNWICVIIVRLDGEWEITYTSYHWACWCAWLPFQTLYSPFDWAGESRYPFSLDANVYSMTINIITRRSL